MAEPELYREYLMWKAIADFGGGEARSVCGGQWVITRDSVLGFIEVGAPPWMSSFPNCSRFRWVAHRVPGSVLPGYISTFGQAEWPDELFAGRVRGIPISLFVSKDGGAHYLYVGRLDPSRALKMGESHFYFALTPALPGGFWEELGGGGPNPTDPAVLEAALRSLRAESPPVEKRDVLRLLAEYLHGPLGPESGLPEEAISRPMPESLRWWYRQAGRVSDIFIGHRQLDPPDWLAVRDGRLIFGSEGGGDDLATEPGGDDPPVYRRAGNEAPWVETGTSLLGHLMLACLSGACMNPTFGGSTRITARSMNQLTKAASQLSFPPLPRGYGLYGGRGVFLFAEDHLRTDFSLRAFAPSEQPLARLACLFDGPWEHLDWQPVIDPHWLAWSGGSIRHMARIIRDDNRLADLPILADALADAGCDDDTLLGHLREPGIHHKGCRVLDAILAE